MSLKGVLIFATGTDSLPALGFETKPTVTFQNDCLYATANTCGLELRLPIIHKTYEEFKSSVMTGIANCQDFAFA